MKKFIAFGFILAVVACSSKEGGKTTTPGTSSDPTAPGNDTTTTAEEDGGTVDSSTATTPPMPPSGPTNKAECVSVCEVKYPKPAALNKTLDSTCFLAGVCEGDCNDLVAGKNYLPTADPDAGPTCDTAKANSYPISTPAQKCSDCIARTPACCNLWIAIFGSDDGKALNACSNACFTSFKN